MGSGDRSNCCDVKGDGPFGRGRSETNRITIKTNEGKDKMNGDKGAALKVQSVTQPIMSMRRRDRKEGSETFEGLEIHTCGGSPNDLLL